MRLLFFPSDHGRFRPLPLPAFLAFFIVAIAARAAIDPPSAQDLYSGVFRNSRGEYIYIQPWPGGEGKLLYSDDEGRVRALTKSPSAAGDVFIGGPGLVVSSPTELTVTFVSDAKKNVLRLLYAWSGEGPRTASRMKQYTSERVRFRNAALSLGGTLWRPPGKGPHPAIVLIHGSGQTDRYNVLPLVHFLLTHGVALFGYDKRGVGESSGNWRTAGIQDLASDARAAVDFVSRRHGIDPRRVGVLGASHGGWVAPLAASGPDARSAFVISVSGPALSPARLEELRVRELLLKEGFSEEDVGKVEALLAACFDVARGKREWKDVEALIAAAEPLRWFHRLELPRTERSPLFDHWRSLPLDYDPVVAISALRVPTLAIFGSLDQTVLPIPNAREWARDMEGGRADLQVITLKGANHMLLESSTGADEEYRLLRRFAPNFAAALLGWLRRQGIAE